MRNEGIPLDPSWLRGSRNPEARIVERARELEATPLPRGKEAIEGLLGVLRSIDLTTLSSDDTTARIRRLCRRARVPLPLPLRDALGVRPDEIRVAAVCVFPAFVPQALEALEGSGLPVATVSAGFPHGLSSLSQRIREVEAAVEAGAQEVDVVIRREWVLTGQWEKLYREVRAFREAVGKAHLKVILGTGDLDTLNQVGRGALTAMMAGADFVKTSTGKEKVNATLPVGLAMARSIRAYETRTGFQVGLKPAGGIRTARDGYRWLELVRQELGEEWGSPELFRIGASGLLGDVVGTLASRLDVSL
jgi:deoxyribose-phosphate aldolase